MFNIWSVFWAAFNSWSDSAEHINGAASRPAGSVRAAGWERVANGSNAERSEWRTEARAAALVEQCARVRRSGAGARGALAAAARRALHRVPAEALATACASLGAARATPAGRRARCQFVPSMQYEKPENFQKL